MTRLTFYGARGSYPVSGPDYRRYGGHTSCVALETDKGMIVMDAGTGMASLGDALCRRDPIPPVTVLFTHFHLDHIAGITAFRPFFKKKVQVTLMADSGLFPGWPDALKTLAGRPFWPVDPLKSGARVQFKPLPGSEPGVDLYGVKISWCPVWHPQGCASYRFSVAGRGVVLATDREHGNREMDKRFLDFCRGTDLLIHDAQFTPEEHASRVGWGHSTWEAACRLALEAKVKSLVLTSHDPARTDSDLEQLVGRAKGIFRSTVAAREGMELEIKGGSAK